MKVLFKLSFVALFILVAYFAVTESGLVEHFNNVINEKDGWKKVSENNYKKYVIITTHWVDAYLLHDQNGKEFKVYEGAVKKSVTDQLSLLGVTRIEIEDRNDGNYSKDKLSDILKKEAEKYEANIIIITSSGSYYKTETQTVGLGF
jgi:hypothetical protein